jgi:hypothetical protein
MSSLHLINKDSFSSLIICWIFWPPLTLAMPLGLMGVSTADYLVLDCTTVSDCKNMMISHVSFLLRGTCGMDIIAVIGRSIPRTASTA